MINFDVQEGDRELIEKIVHRFFDVQAFYSQERTFVPTAEGLSWLDLMMDITAVHAGICPLDLEGMLEAPPIDLVHDVTGISSNLDREKGLLVGFSPRLAKLDAEPSDMEP